MQFPYIVRSPLRRCQRFGQRGVAVVAARQFGVLEKCGNACATGEPLICPNGIGASFSQNRIGSPSGMAAAHRENGITERRCARPEWAGRWSAEWRGQAGATLALANPPPLANGPDRAVQRGRNLGIGLPCRGGLPNGHTFFKRGRLCTTCHHSRSFLPMNGDAGAYGSASHEGVQHDETLGQATGTQWWFSRTLCDSNEVCPNLMRFA
jgi:hypothetical protein